MPLFMFGRITGFELCDILEFPSYRGIVAQNPRRSIYSSRDYRPQMK